jgi:hypothetical protein
MYVAVGRLQVTVTVDERAGGHGLGRQTSPRPDAAQRAYARERLERAVEADRARWERTSYLCAPRRL